MLILRHIPPRQKNERRAILIGKGDGIHRGHQQLILHLIKKAQDHNAIPTFLTFHPHPRTILKRDETFTLLTPFRLKMARLARLGIAQCISLPFHQLRLFSPQQFIDDILMPLGTCFLLTGEGFTFGYKARGTQNDLKLAARTKGFIYETHPAVCDEKGRRIASQDIRTAITKGEMKQAAAWLGQPWEIAGRIIQGAGRGKKMGVPTANLKLHPAIHHPRYGCYGASVGLFNEKNRAFMWQGAIAYWGQRPFFEKNNAPPQLEVHLFGSDDNLYGEYARVRFLQFLREDKNFKSQQLLQDAMAQDINQARHLFLLT